MLFRLLAGLHEQADPDWERPEDADPAARAPSRTYRTGEIVESDSDLVDKFGPQKFQYVGESRAQSKFQANPRFGASDPMEDQKPGDPSPELRRKIAAVAPHGQVTTGFQQTTGLPDSVTPGQPLGRTVAGPLQVEGETAEDRSPGDHTIESRSTPKRGPTTARAPEDVSHLDESPDRPSGPGATSQPRSGPVAGSRANLGSEAKSEEGRAEDDTTTLKRPFAGEKPDKATDKPVDDAALERMTVHQLKQHAEDEEIEVPASAKTKEEIIKIIKIRKHR